ncbi:hypothetical protein [Lentzea sp. NPDC003310]
MTGGSAAGSAVSPSATTATWRRPANQFVASGTMRSTGLTSCSLVMP